jgi:UDP-N-acetylmuramoyl-L-alanyl-D-glutamate--2,6-diaminopimelate ligase
VEAILRAAGRRVGLLGTIEYRCGATTFPGERTTPESSDLQRLLARMHDMGAWGAAMEVSSHSLVLHRVAACEFDVAVFTNLTQDHLDFHGTMERYAEAKARLFQDLGQDRVKPGVAAAVLNADDPWADFMAQRTRGRIIRFSLAPGADVAARTAQFDLAGIRAAVTSPWGPLDVCGAGGSPQPGQHPRRRRIICTWGPARWCRPGYKSHRGAGPFRKVGRVSRSASWWIMRTRPMRWSGS